MLATLSMGTVAFKTVVLSSRNSRIFWLILPDIVFGPCFLPHCFTQFIRVHEKKYIIYTFFLVQAAIGSLQSYVFLASKGVYGFWTIRQLLYHLSRKQRKLFQERMYVSIMKSIHFFMQLPVRFLVPFLFCSHHTNILLGLMLSLLKYVFRIWWNDFWVFHICLVGCCEMCF